MALSKITTESLLDGEITAAKFATGVGESKVVQVVNVQSASYATGTTALPMDGSIPQISEGNEFMTLAVTPTSASNKLIIHVILYGAGSAAQQYSCALFQDSTANALSVDSHYSQGANEKYSNFVIHHYMAAGTTSATTFKVRMGHTGGATAFFNGSHDANLDHGAANKSSITIWEILV